MSPRKPKPLPRVGELVMVRAREGLRVPRENAPRRHITSAAAVRVRISPYYRRILRDGDLEVVKPTADKEGGK